MFFFPKKYLVNVIIYRGTATEENIVNIQFYNDTLLKSLLKKKKSIFVNNTNLVSVSHLTSCILTITSLVTYPSITICIRLGYFHRYTYISTKVPVYYKIK